MKRRLAAILAADVVGYSRLMGADEPGTLGRLKFLHKDLVQPQIGKAKGRIVKLMGDGLLAEFPSVVEAVRCAVEIQEAIRAREADRPADERLKLRIGVNLGDIIVEGSDIFGDGVNVAARLEVLAEPGGICISGPAFDTVDGKLDLHFEDMGPQKVKNIAKPIRAYRLVSGARQDDPPAAWDAPPPLPNKPSIVVLPFDNMSGDPEQDYFSDGITEDIITELSRFERLLVIARNTAFTYRNQKIGVPQIARELGVQFVLEGSVRKAGNRVRISTQLVDGLSGNHVWAERYDGDPITAHGITDALRDAELLSRAVTSADPDAMAVFHSVREDLSRLLFETTDAMASFEWDMDEIKAHHADLIGAMDAELAYMLEEGTSMRMVA